MSSTLPKMTSDYGDAKKLSEREMAVIKTKAYACKEKGNDFYKRGHFARAIQSYTDAIDYDPGNSTFYSNRAMAYFKIKEWNRVLEDCDAALKIDPTNVKAFLRRAAYYDLKGNLKMALADYTHVLQLEPTHSQAKKEIARLTNPAEQKSTFKSAKQVFGDAQVQKTVKGGEGTKMLIEVVSEHNENEDENSHYLDKDMNTKPPTLTYTHRSTLSEQKYGMKIEVMNEEQKQGQKNVIAEVNNAGTGKVTPNVNSEDKNFVENKVREESIEIHQRKLTPTQKTKIAVEDKHKPKSSQNGKEGPALAVITGSENYLISKTIRAGGSADALDNISSKLGPSGQKNGGDISSLENISRKLGSSGQQNGGDISCDTPTVGKGAKPSTPHSQTLTISNNNTGTKAVYVPSNAVDFERVWKEAGSDIELRYRTLEAMNPDSYMRTFSTSMSEDLVNSIVNVLSECYMRDGVSIYPVLLGLSKVERFGLAVMFMSDINSKLLCTLFNYIEVAEHVSKDCISALKKAYGI
eukprot:CFRG7335T1